MGHPVALSGEGTAKHSVFKQYFEEDYKKIAQWKRAMDMNKFKEAEGIALPGWYNITNYSNDWAVSKIIEDTNTLWYCTEKCAPDQISRRKVIGIQMDDTQYIYGGLMLNSEWK